MPQQRLPPLLGGEQQQIVEPGQQPPGDLRTRRPRTTGSPRTRDPRAPSSPAPAGRAVRPRAGPGGAAAPSGRRTATARNCTIRSRHCTAVVGSFTEGDRARSAMSDSCRSPNAGSWYKVRSTPTETVRLRARPRRRRPAVHGEHRRARHHEVPDPGHQPQDDPVPACGPHQPCHRHIPQHPGASRWRTCAVRAPGGVSDLCPHGLPRERPGATRGRCGRGRGRPASAAGSTTHRRRTAADSGRPARASAGSGAAAPTSPGGDRAPARPRTRSAPAGRTEGRQEHGQRELADPAPYEDPDHARGELPARHLHGHQRDAEDDTDEGHHRRADGGDDRPGVGGEGEEIARAPRTPPPAGST